MSPTTMLVPETDASAQPAAERGLLLAGERPGGLAAPHARVEEDDEGAYTDDDDLDPGGDEGDLDFDDIDAEDEDDE